MNNRQQARDSVYKLIYEYTFTREPNERSLAIATSADLPAEEVEYIRTVYYGVIEKFDEISAEIASYAMGFRLERIYKLDLSALLLAIYEMRYMHDIPLSVSINEAVALVKTYSTEKSNSFVNGILSSVFKSISGKDA